MSKEFKIGLVVLLGILLLFSAYVFFHTITFRSQTYEIKTIFRNLEKLDTGAIVRLSGFKIGNVTEIQLTEESYVLVKMRIDKNIKIPKDSYCLATTGAVIGEMFIKINPGESHVYLENGDTIQGVSKTSFDDLTKSVGELLTTANSSMKKVDDLLNNKDYINEIMKNIQDTTVQINMMSKKMDLVMNNITQITGDASYVIGQSKEDLTKTVDNVRVITDNAVAISEDLNKFVNNDALPQVKDLLYNANLTMNNLNDTLVTAKEIMVDLDSKIGGVGDLIKDADAILVKSQNTIDNIDMLLGSMNDAAQSTTSVINKVDSFLGDKENSDNIKATIANIKETSEEAKKLMQKLNSRLESNSGDKLSGHVTSENMYNGHDKKFRSDFYTDMFYGKNGIRLGINDIGERNKGIIQYQKKFNNNNIGKIGVFNSKLGLGYEYVNGNFNAAIDWYNPNRSEVYRRGKYRFTPNFGVFLGVDDLIQKENRNFLFGISIEK